MEKPNQSRPFPEGLYFCFWRNLSDWDPDNWGIVIQHDLLDSYKWVQPLLYPERVNSYLHWELYFNWYKDFNSLKMSTDVSCICSQNTGKQRGIYLHLQSIRNSPKTGENTVYIQGIQGIITMLAGRTQLFLILLFFSLTLLLYLLLVFYSLYSFVSLHLT